MARCRSCDAPIVWVKTKATGTAFPLDPNPQANGNVLVENGVGVVLNADQAAERRAAGQVLYTGHHATCPDGRSWRRKGQAAVPLFEPDGGTRGD